MGTQHLIEVELDGQLRIAQYGQWDGYPTGQGEGIAEFIHGQYDREKFKTALLDCRFMNDTDFAAVDESNWKVTHPQLSRDVGSDILGNVQDDGVRLLKDSSDFKEDRLFCEYYYRIDANNETVSMNRGTPIPFAEWTIERMSQLEREKSEA